MIVAEGERSGQTRYILNMNMKPTGFSNGLDVGDKEREKSRMIPRFLA